MKVKEFMAKALLTSEQKVKLYDHGTAKTFITRERCVFGIDSDEVERIFKLRVLSFAVSDAGLTIHAE